MKIGIYTIHACNNFGAMLQAYATARFLNEHGHEAELVNVVTDKAQRDMSYIGPWSSSKGIVRNLYALLNPTVYKKIDNFRKFRQLMPLSKKYYSTEEVVANPPHYDLHLVGSDQVWNVERGMGSSFFFLPFIHDTVKKASFASSFGNIEPAHKYTEELKTLLARFSHISVREADAASFINQELQIKAAHVLDPTFLLNAEEWGEIAGNEPLVKGNYILYYGFDTSKTCGDVISHLKKQMNMPVIGISVSLHSPYKFDKFYQEAGPVEFLNLIKYARLVLTSSFHGMALSINFRKDFVVLRHGTRMSRMESLLNDFSLKDCIIDDASAMAAKNGEYKVMYSNERILELTNNSKHFLLSIIDKIKDKRESQRKI